MRYWSLPVLLLVLGAIIVVGEIGWYFQKDRGALAAAAPGR